MDPNGHSLPGRSSYTGYRAWPVSFRRWMSRREDEALHDWWRKVPRLKSELRRLTEPLLQFEENTRVYRQQSCTTSRLVQTSTWHFSRKDPGQDQQDEKSRSAGFNLHLSAQTPAGNLRVFYLVRRLGNGSDVSDCRKC